MPPLFLPPAGLSGFPKAPGKNTLSWKTNYCKVRAAGIEGLLRGSRGCPFREASMGYCPVTELVDFGKRTKSWVCGLSQSSHEGSRELSTYPVSSDGAAAQQALGRRAKVCLQS